MKYDLASSQTPDFELEFVTVATNPDSLADVAGIRPPIMSISVNEIAFHQLPSSVN